MTTGMTRVEMFDTEWERIANILQSVQPKITNITESNDIELAIRAIRRAVIRHRAKEEAAGAA